MPSLGLPPHAAWLHRHAREGFEVRALDLRVERLEQCYLRVGRVGSSERYRYAAPDFGVECDLSCDESGLVTEYPGIAVRVG